MDLFKDAAKNLNLYEVKAYVRKAQNVAMNLTEMESKVREATNNEPWGASSTLMQQIAAGTYNYREREEIIAFIFRRFTEKAANEWRQIYKSLQLLEYLIKNGSERIIDDVRANVSLIQMLKSFHYIDSKGRDQGINVRNKAKNLITFLNDDHQIRTERKKARQNQKKFGGFAGGASTGGSSYGASSGSSGSFGDEDFSNRVYGDGGVYGESYAESSYSNGTGGEQFNEYDEYEVSPPAASSKPTTRLSHVNATNSNSNSRTKSKSVPAPEPPTKKPTQDDLIADLLDLDVSGTGSNTATATTTTTNNNNNNNHNFSAAAADDDFDDFDDFQSAPSQQLNIQSQSQSQWQPQPQTQNIQSQWQTQPSTQSPLQTPAHQQGAKKADPFSNLFSTAVNTKTTNTPVNKTNTTTTTTAKPVEELDLL